MKPKQKGENEEKLETEGMGIVKEGGRRDGWLYTGSGCTCR